MKRVSAVLLAAVLLSACAVSGRIDDAVQQGKEVAAEVADDRLATGIYLTCTATLTSILRRFTTQEAMDAYLAFCLPQASVAVPVDTE